MHHPERHIHLRSSARTSIGQVRENNEDNVHLWERGQAVLAIVADGMGGAAAGEEASRLAVESIDAGLLILDSDNPVESIGEDTLAQKLRQFIRTANANIVERANADPGLRGMGTTVTLALVRDAQAIIAHVGDSRAYLISGRDRTIGQITADHSFVEALVAAGHITQQQAEEHPMRNVLYRALGQNEDIDIDVYHVILRTDDRLVLCSDGLTRHVKPVEIAQVCLDTDDPDVASQQLIDLANERGGEDNVSVIVIHVDDDEPDWEAVPVDDDTQILPSNIAARIEDDTLISAHPLRKKEPTRDDDSPTLNRKTIESDIFDRAISKRADLLPDANNYPTIDDDADGEDTLRPKQ